MWNYVKHHKTPEEGSTDSVKEYQREYQRRYREKNREKLNAYAREWRKANPEKMAAISQRYWEKKRNEKRVHDT